MQRQILMMSLLTLWCGALFAQKVTGTVYGLDEKKRKVPLVGVNVYWVHDLKGTTSDQQGKFSIVRDDPGSSLHAEEEHSNHLLVFSYVGYVNDTIHVHQDLSNLEIILSQVSELEAVEITGRPQGAFISRIQPVVTQQINRAELQKAACCNLSESFETNASVDVNYTDAITGAKQIQLLGLAGIYSQLMTENIPNFNGLSNTYGLMWVPGPWMESIQVSKGTAAVLNGYESISGQINIEYKKPDQSEKLFLNLFTDSEGRIESNMNAATELNPRWSTMVYGHFSRNANRMDHNYDGFMDQPLYTQFNFMNRWKYVGRVRETQFGVHFIDEVRTGGQMNFDREQRPGLDKPYGIDIHNRRWFAFAKNGFLLSRPNTSVAMINSFSWHDQGALIGLRKYDALQKSSYNNLILQSYIGNPQHQYSTGITYIFNNVSEQLNDSVSTLRESVPGLYFQYTYQQEEKLTLIAGLRSDFHNRYGTFFTPRFHVRYALTPNTIVRASAGKGYRTPMMIAENLSFLASSRKLQVTGPIRQEEAINVGVHLTQYIDLFHREMTITADFYHTSFRDQMIVDLDTDERKLLIYNLSGKSFSRAAHLEVLYEPLKGLDVLAAIRWNDVKITYGDQLMQKPLVSRYKGLITLSYATTGNRWQFDFTSQFNGGGRIPSTRANPVEYQLSERFSPYTILNAQITRYFKRWNIYIGGENLLNFTQHHPVLAAENPFGEYFDASLVWGPIMGRKFYAGLRFTLD